ncbi:hypothetical protein [Paraburkholderia dinghuensis]|uniref:DUF5666 domain-containing protein n=1 Tax=Paraburkholderia dinghuensis TaxID=2305225 RepID=A0A3N6MTJ4_9BURK|nr:hypothetical protein [Paraburkholderia dinghuensis]RQH07019.1 hypothetical protein D1Y85_10090 [Paraburkholderia dinghuensis]
MPKLKLLAAAVIVGVAQLACAQAQAQTNATVAKAPGKVAAAGVHKVTAEVLSVDPATRTVRLKREDGETFEIQVGDEARNFDQIRVGDKVTATYHEALTLSLKKGGGEAASVSETPSMERAPKGGKPGGTIGREVRIVADVVAVNEKTKTVTLKGPEGNTVDLLVEDPAQLANVKTGDQVEAVFTEALAISVKPAHAK